MRICGRKEGFALGCNLRQWIHSDRPMDTLFNQQELLLSLGWVDNHVPRSTLPLQLTSQSYNQLVSKEGEALGNNGWYLNECLWQFLGLSASGHLY